MTVGYVVVCWNQASGWPDIDSPGLYETRGEAEIVADAERAETAKVGRQERFLVCEVVKPYGEEPR